MSEESSPQKKESSPPHLYCGGQEPLFLAALAFASGILAANFLWRSPFIWLAGFVLALTAATFSLRRSPQLTFFCALLAVVPLGALYLQARDAAQPTIAADPQPFGTGEDF